jgi:hypothetical protein
MKGNMTCQSNVLKTITLTYKDRYVRKHGDD